MIDTNALSQIQQAAPAAQSAFNAWTVVAAAGGAFLTHAYHSIKAAGGFKNIFRGLWDGGAEYQAKPLTASLIQNFAEPIRRFSPPAGADQEIGAPSKPAAAPISPVSPATTNPIQVNT